MDCGVNGGIPNEIQEKYSEKIPEGAAGLNPGAIEWIPEESWKKYRKNSQKNHRRDQWRNPVIPRGIPDEKPQDIKYKSPKESREKYLELSRM